MTHKEGETNSRYKSWEYCHEAFKKCKGRIPDTKLDNTEKLSEEEDKIVDSLSLHLAFYLASWGMYRGSSELLQRDYKTHKEAVKRILKTRYEDLWDYNPNDNKISIKKANDLLFNEEDGIYWEIIEAYTGFKNRLVDSDFPSETLITKILLGTFGCVPAFDRFFKKGIGYYKDEVSGNINGHKLTQSVEIASNEQKASDTFKSLASFACDENNKEALKVEGTQIEYPPMKCLDMLFWEIGFELDLRDALYKNKNDVKDKSKKLLEQAKRLFKMDFSSCEDAVKTIDSIYPKKNKTAITS